MPHQPILNAQEISSHLQSLPGWTWDSATAALKRDLTFQDFTAAFSFMTRVAFLAERMNHHPDWCNAYNRLSIALTTHSSGGVTIKDVEMARAISDIHPDTAQK